MTGADMLAAWHDHLALGLRRSPHTVRAYGTAAQRLLTRMDLAT
ncbi:MAG TPA: recombinase XerC, partial [Erythrobacter sp.]|nr:recombinase XerC [Erythrobacter sp.]